MNDMTTRQPKPVRRIRPKPAPVLLLPEWRVKAPAPVVIDIMALARAGRATALAAKAGPKAAKAARKAQAFQPIEVVLIDADFRARVEAIANRRGIPQVYARPVATARPLAAG